MALPTKLNRGPQGMPGGAAAPYKPRAKRLKKMVAGGQMPRSKKLNPEAMANDLKQRSASAKVAKNGKRSFFNDGAMKATKAAQYAARASRGA